MARVNHFEIPVDDAARASKFFSEVFGWQISQWGDQPYWMAVTGDDPNAGINGALIQRTDPPQPVVNTIEVANIDDTIVNIRAAGGVIVMDKMPIPTVGHMIYFLDTEGNTHGAIQLDESVQ
ncbi:MAG: VOC family protein [Bacteroidia bacterium]|nr:VOC family protein [Bacteroidia bacterium]